MIEDEIIDALKDILKEGIELKKNLQSNDDNNMNYKNEPSLSAMGGKEITTPICTYEDLKQYISKIAKIIDQNGSTDENTGFHIHISTIDENIEVDFYKFMLLCSEASLLHNWGDRNAFCLNVMDVLTVLNIKEANKLKSKKGRVWNLEKRREHNKTNHVEIRTIGGTNYQRKVEQILSELNQFIEIFNRSIKNQNRDEAYKSILQEHMEILKSASEERKEKFLQLIR
ncbi:MAG: hypothetical protein PHO62_06815 [Sulfurimonas sp.]|uniref:hypothetical protein n=1 Tax=Sulfurimonas sp. TaxID=2022749 RepID=UPI0026177873|nr:hypothetical protein [Sulfurimonas sp.]MDD5373122.1 hypothetical protein [Sulfurimonas sp.]